MAGFQVTTEGRSAKSSVGSLLSERTHEFSHSVPVTMDMKIKDLPAVTSFTFEGGWKLPTGRHHREAGAVALRFAGPAGTASIEPAVVMIDRFERPFVRIRKKRA